MARHRLRLRIPARVVLNKDAELDVYSGKTKLGTVRMSRGSIEWLPVKHTYGYHLMWEQFDALMRIHGVRIVPRRPRVKVVSVEELPVEEEVGGEAQVTHGAATGTGAGEG